METKDDAIKELNNAVAYIDKITNCDDYDLSAPNGDTLSISIKFLNDYIKELKEEIKVSKKLYSDLSDNYMDKVTENLKLKRQLRNQQMKVYN